MNQPTEIEPPYKIVGLKINNVLKIKLVELSPTGDFITIGGDNANGKTSLLNGICMALEGSGATSDQPIRTGNTTGSIHLELSKGAQYKLGDLIIDVTFDAAKGRKMTVKTREGAPIKSPQEVLNSLYNHIALEPLAWMTMDAPKQSETLRKLAGLDFTKLDSDRAAKYTQRTEVNRQVDQKKARLVGMPHHAGAPDAEVSAKTLMEELREIQKVNQSHATNRAGMAVLDANVATEVKAVTATKTRIKEIEKQLQDACALLIEQETKHAKALDLKYAAQAKIDALVDQDETGVNARIEANDTQNQKVRENKARTDLENEISPLAKQSQDLTTDIDALDAEKSRQLSEAKFPLPGLSFSGDTVTLNGVPFSQASGAESIVASAAIGMAMNPKLRVILIRNASLIGPSRMKALSDWAEKEKVQVFCEVVTAGENASEASVVLSDGEVLTK